MRIPFTSLALLAFAAYAIGEDAAEQPQDLRGNSDKPFAYTGEDLTRLPTRLGVSYDSGVNHHTGSNTDNYLVTGSLSLLGLQALAEVPVYARTNPNGGATQDGFGDTFVSGAFSLPFNPKMRLAIGLDVVLDTASRDDLGAGETIYAPFLAIAAEMDESNMGVFKLSYTDSDGDVIERWELLIRGLHRWNDQLFTSVEVVPGWDSLNDEFILNTRALVGARVDRHNVASIEFAIPIDSDSRDQRGSNLRLNYNFLF
jgi:hypothetical protein